MDFTEIIYEKRDGVARVTINRPEKLNAATTTTMTEMVQALSDAWVDSSIGVVVLTGVGDRAFCTGGDQSIREAGGYATGAMTLPLEVIWQQATQLIRSLPKPVIARVNGYAIGGGHVLQVACDLSIASETAQFGQAGPRVGSFDPGVGTGDLVRCVGMKRAKEIWYLCRRYTAQEALEMGLVNKVVPDEKLEEEVEAWCQDILKLSPTALKIIKGHFQADSEHYVGLWNLSADTLKLFEHNPEVAEGANAFLEKREPDFWKFYET